MSVWTDTARLAADFVILAAPAPLARQLHPGADALEPPLRATTCSAAINLAVMTAPHFRLPTVLRGVYGLAVPRGERRHLAAITIESHKDPRRAPHGGLFNLMLCGGSATTLLAAPDHTLLAAVRPEAERYLPGLRAALVATRIFRWPHAAPRSPVGRARAVHAYRADCRRTPRRLLLAGAPFGAPFAEGAAESGRWATGHPRPRHTGVRIAPSMALPRPHFGRVPPGPRPPPHIPPEAALDSPPGGPSLAHFSLAWRTT